MIPCLLSLSLCLHQRPPVKLKISELAAWHDGVYMVCYQGTDEVFRGTSEQILSREEVGYVFLDTAASLKRVVRAFKRRKNKK
jgi:hypothetical protein